MRAPRLGWRQRVALVLGLALLFVALAHPLAGASDVWGNVGPASPLGSGALLGRYPLSHYMLDQHFDAVSASLTGGVDVSGVPPMIAYFLASVIWALTSFLANTLISLFSFAFGLDLVNGSRATGGAGALGPVAQAIHSIYASVFGGPWLVLAVAVAGIWAMWKALVQRRYAETAGALGLSLVYVVVALFFVAQPGKTIGAASEWTNRMSVVFLSVASHGNPSNGPAAREGGAQQLFDLLVVKPWAVLEFGGLEHCVVAGTGSEDSDPESVAVRPLSEDPSQDAALARRLAAGTGIAAGRKACVNDANKYGPHFLRFAVGTDERSAEYDALDHGDSSKLPDADPERRGYRLGVADKPATDAMEEGGQYQRLLLAIVVFCGELGAFCLLGALSVGVILAQVLLLLLLAFSPVALVAAAIPGRGHAFFKGWLEKLCGFLLRKAAYSLVLAILLAVNGALASRHGLARLADVLRPAGTLLLGGLPAAKGAGRGPGRDRHRAECTWARGLAAAACPLRRRPSPGYAFAQPGPLGFSCACGRRRSGPPERRRLGLAAQR